MKFSFKKLFKYSLNTVNFRFDTILQQDYYYKE